MLASTFDRDSLRIACPIRVEKYLERFRGEIDALSLTAASFGAKKEKSYHTGLSRTIPVSLHSTMQ